MDNIFVIIGLGNPDKKYERTYHNMGFMVVDKFANNNNLTFQNKPKFNSMVAEFNVNNAKVVVVKPQTYMNSSGIAVQKIKNFYKINNKNLIVVYDDIDLPLGAIRLREKGSAGTHNGMRSIVECLGATDFPRLRIGVGANTKFKNLADFVVSEVGKKELEILNGTFDSACQMLEKFIEFNGNVVEVLNWVNKNK